MKYHIEGSQHLFHIIVSKSISMALYIRDSSAWWLPVCMVHVTALDIQVSLYNHMANVKCIFTQKLFVDVWKR